MSKELNDARPKAREHALVIEQMEDEVLVYDLETDRAHCLNATSALIWKHCDGATTIDQLAKLLEREMASPASREIIWLALGQLSRRRLMAEVPKAPASVLVSRRALIRSLGIAAAALPVITSLVVPTPAEAATCLSPGQACTTAAECCSGVCQTPPGNGTCA